MNLFYIILITLLIVNKSVNSCYITNCPWGGKRSIEETSNHECNKCANGLGMCYGPRICCGQEIGCLLDTKETLSCRNEDTESASPCTPYGKSCSKVEFGRCATNRLCCSPDRCVPDNSCSSQDDSSEDLSDLKSHKEKKLLDAIIKYLLKDKKLANEEKK